MLLVLLLIVVALATALVTAELWLSRLYRHGCWVTCLGRRGRWRGDVTGVSGCLLQVRSTETGREHLVLPFLARR